MRQHQAGGHLITLPGSVGVHGRPGQTAIDLCAQKTLSSFPVCADSVTRPLRTTYGRFFHSAVIGHSFHGPITASSGVTRVPCGHRAATAVHLSDGEASIGYQRFTF